MFVADEHMDRKCLRQGDILARIPFPLLQLKDLRILARIQTENAEFPYPMVTSLSEHRKDTNFFTAQMLMRLSFFSVLTHCCELELKHNKFQPAAFALARLIPIRPSIIEFPDKLASLRANKDPRHPTEPGYIDYFHIAGHERLENREWMVDFNQVLSLPNREFPAILQWKILQMDNRTRVKFKIKHAVYQGRITDEEDAEGLRNPWADQA